MTVTGQVYLNPKIDRSTWGEGPWDGEPDKVSWTDQVTGYPCMVTRANPDHGSWCGYVAVEPVHPLHGAGIYADAVLFLDVHDAVTFAAACADDEPVESAVCHVPEPGRPADVWWFGFSCAGAFDARPAWDARDRELGRGADRPGTYRTVEFARAECGSLAQQLKAIETEARS